VNTDRDYSRLSQFLKRLSLRQQLFAVIEFLILLASGTLVILLGSLFVLRFKDASPYLPCIYSLASILFLASLIFLSARRIFQRPSVERVARTLEETVPGLNDDVTNSILLIHDMEAGLDAGQISRALVLAQLRKTVGKIDDINPAEVVNLKKGFRHLRLLVPLTAILCLVFIADPHFLGRTLAVITHPLSDLTALQTSIALEPKDLIVLRNTPIDIRASASGKVPEKLMLMIRPDGSEPLRYIMEPEAPGKFRYHIAAAQASFQYQAYNGRSASPVGSVRVVEAPDLEEIRLALAPPSYTRLPSDARGGGHIEALRGTIVTLSARATKLLKEGELVLDEGSRHFLEVSGEHLSGSLLVLEAGSYTIRLKDEFGFENINPVRYQIRVIPDAYPEVHIVSPAKNLEVGGDEVIPIIYSARDDFGLTAVRLVFQLRGQERTINLRSPHEGQSIGPETFKWDLSGLALSPGDSVSYHIEVDDNDAVSGPKKGFSQGFTIAVRDDKALALKEGEEARALADALLDLLANQLEEKHGPETLTKQMDKIVKDVDRTLERIGNKVERFDLEALKRNLASLKERVAQEPRERVTQEMERLALLAEDIAQRSRMSEVEAMAREIKNKQRHLIDSLKDFKGPLNKEAMEQVMKELKKLEELLRSVMDALSKMATRLPDEFINSQELAGLEFQDLFKDLDEMYQKLMAGDVEAALEAAQRLMQQLSEMMAAMGRAGTRAGTSPFDRLQSEMSRQAGELDKILAEQRQILGETEKIKRELTEKQEQQTLLKELRETIEGVSPRADEPGRGLETERFPDLSDRQERLKQRTKDFLEKLELMAQLFPGMDTEILKDMESATESMQHAAGKLKREDAPGAIPPEEEAIRKMAKSQQSMQQMAQQMGMRMQAARWGYQLVYDPRPGWYYGPWAPMPTLPQPELYFPREKGYTGIDKEEFDPPSKDAYQVPKMFREKIMDSLREEVSSSYKRDAQRYLRDLAE
jgi:hypothetical protein